MVFAFAMEAGHNTNNNRNTPFLPYNYDQMFGFSCDQSGWNCVCMVPSKDNTGTLVPYAGTSNPKSFIFDYGDKLGAPFDRMNNADIRKQPLQMRCRRQLAREYSLWITQKDWNTGADVLADADLQDKPLIYVDQGRNFPEPRSSARTRDESAMGRNQFRLQGDPLPYLSTSTGLDWRNADQVEFRLAEVYYTLAECYMRSGNPSMAKSYVNQVRGRYFRRIRSEGT